MPETISVYNKAKEQILNSTVDLDADTIRVILLNNSATFNAANTLLTQINTNEIANGNGYTTGGATLAGKVVTFSGGTSTFDANDVTWNITGSAVTAFKALVYDDTHADDLPLFFIDFDGAKTADPGAPFNINWSASGIATLS